MLELLSPTVNSARTLESTAGSVSSSGIRRGAWLALAVLLISNVPQFLCTRLNGDTTYYDLQIQCLNEGGVLYRDMLEPNLPGVVWIHMLVRGLAGWSSVAMRLFDLSVLGAILLLLAWPLRKLDRAGIATACLALSAFWFYLSMSAWGHCQRDLWMLLPAMGALSLRNLSTVNGAAGRRRLGLAVVEGLLWGCAFWIKPHVALPAAAVLATSLLWQGCSRKAIVNCGGVVAGGILAGIAGSAWLLQSGAWPHFWETMLEWNPEYLESRKSWDPWPRYRSLFHSFSPWSWAHLVALPYALFTLLRVGRRRLLRGGSPADSPATSRSAYEALLCALYLGWFAQSVLMQHPFGYIHVPAVLLAIAIVVAIQWPADWQLVPRAVATTVFLAALLLSHCAKPSRLAAWRECVTAGPTLANRALFQARPTPYWRDYPPVVEFLRQHDARGGDVLVYSSMLVPLYRDLDLRPPMRYVLTDVHRGFFRSRREVIRTAIARAGHRFVISDLSESGLKFEDLADTDAATGLPRGLSEAQLQRYPATQPVLFRSGWFVVHAARDAAGL